MLESKKTNSNQPISEPRELAPEGATNGKYKVFLGFAPGVGKTFSMLDEALRRKSRGQDIVVGLVETRGRPATEELVKEFESIPPKIVEVDGKTYKELDVDAIIARKPRIVLVDDFQVSNAPNSPRKNRWEDVEFLLSNGINVLTTLNVQHLESLNDHIYDITGVRIEETIPDHMLRDADEVELVDLTPRALINRLERGDIYPGSEVSQDTSDFFREGNLSALRELTLREIASRVDDDLTEYRKVKHIEKPWATKDRIMICISPTKSSLRLVRRGWRIGQRLHADVQVVYVEDGKVGDKEQKILEDDFALAERLGLDTQKLQGKVAPELIKYAQENNITQIVIGHSERSPLQEVMKGSVLAEIARSLRNIDILVVAAETSEHS